MKKTKAVKYNLLANAVALCLKQTGFALPTIAKALNKTERQVFMSLAYHKDVKIALIRNYADIMNCDLNIVMRDRITGVDYMSMNDYVTNMSDNKRWESTRAPYMFKNMLLLGFDATKWRERDNMGLRQLGLIAKSLRCIPFFEFVSRENGKIYRTEYEYDRVNSIIMETKDAWNE